VSDVARLERSVYAERAGRRRRGQRCWRKEARSAARITRSKIAIRTGARKRGKAYICVSATHRPTFVSARSDTWDDTARRMVALTRASSCARALLTVNHGRFAHHGEHGVADSRPSVTSVPFNSVVDRCSQQDLGSFHRVDTGW